MDDVTIARALHVASVVLWIGGVAMITTVVLPVLRRWPDPAQRLAMFEAIEGRFGLQARAAVLLAGGSGLYMLVRLELWDRFWALPYWWMHAMVLLWAVFATILFVAEPLFLHRWFVRRAQASPDRTFRAAHRLHWVLLGFGLLTLLGAVAGSHGLLLFE